MKFKNFSHKWKSKSKSLRIFYIITLLWYTISLVFFTYNILSLKGIETLIRGIVIGLLILHLLILLLYGLVLLFTDKKKRFIFLLVLTCIYSPILDVASFYIYKTYNIIDNVQKKYVDYTSVMISMKDIADYKKIGIISAKDDPTGYVVPQDMIKTYNIKGELVEYDDYISMTTDLYDGKIDAMFIADSYVTMFQTYDKFVNIATDTKEVYKLTKKLENVDNVSYSTKKLTEPFTVLLMGVDSTGNGISSGSSFNGDSLMMITFNPKTLNATVFSIPRDTYVPIACNQNRENKINSSAYGGTSCVVKTIENLTDVKIDYYVKINFNGVVDLVNDLGGISVDVPISFCEQDSQRRFGKYEICLEKGYQELNGEQALAFARHRHSLPLGDFQRVQHQQMVVEAMVRKLKNIRDVDAFYKILEDVTENVDTNMSTPQILSMYNVAKDILINSLKEDTPLSIEKTYLTGYDLTMYIPSYRSYVYTFQYYKQSLKDIVKLMKVNLELESPTIIKTFDFDANEEYTPVVTGKEYYNEPRRELLPNFIGQSRSYVEDWENGHNVPITYKEEESTSPNGQVINQSFPRGMLIEDIKELVITISKNNGSSVPEPEEDPNGEGEGEGNEGNKPEKLTLPNFVNKDLSEFNKWKNSLKDVNLIIETKELTPEDILTMEGVDLVDNQIYKQSSPEGTELDKISTLTIYYYKAKEE